MKIFHYIYEFVHQKNGTENLLIDLLQKGEINESFNHNKKNVRINKLDVNHLVQLVRKNLALVFHLDSVQNKKDIDTLNHYLLAFLGIVSDSNPECHGQGTEQTVLQNKVELKLLTSCLINFFVNSCLFFYSYL
jgi:hypothetical protein